MSREDPECQAGGELSNQKCRSQIYNDRLMTCTTSLLQKLIKPCNLKQTEHPLDLPSLGAVAREMGQQYVYNMEMKRSGTRVTM